VSLRSYLYRSERAFDFLDAPIQRITTAILQRLILSLIEEWFANADVIKAVKKVMYNNELTCYEASSFI
jgi:pyruvate/2-oxoglutarate/acetoin dehydrogenase E1 component